ncbi:hypothetical protein [Qipengyuania flava]|uniref:hypothetical protein n=1 Tax=Qipengyuania flava TaxID=192812 RepID=UPI00141BF559|nr:hypothetical protein [Qipengyuania flava]NIJ60567.1 hypothetical protein [Qipengyuania flava]
MHCQGRRKSGGTDYQRKTPRTTVGASLLPSLPEWMAAMLLFSIFVAGFSQLLGGYFDLAAILIILVIAFMRDRILGVSVSCLFVSAIAVAYGFIWIASCSPQTCSAEVVSTGTTVWQFGIYLLLFSIIAAHRMVWVSQKSVVIGFLAFFLFLSATNQASIFESLRGLNSSQFFNSYRFGIGNEVNNINFIALFSASLTPFAFPRSPRDFSGYLATFLVLIVVVSTYSRGALLVTGILAALSGFVLWRGFRSKIFLFVFILIGAGSLYWAGYFEKRSFDIGDASISARLRVFALLNDLELFGNKFALSSHFSRRGAIDNTLLRHLIGAGAGVSLLLFAFWSVFGAALKSWSLGGIRAREALSLFGWSIALVLDDTFFSLWGAFLLGNFLPDIGNRRPTVNSVGRFSVSASAR